MPTENTTRIDRAPLTTESTFFSGGEWRYQVSVDAGSRSVTTTTSRTSTNTPKFRSKKRPVPLPVNAFSFTQTIDRLGRGWKRDESATLIRGRPQTTNLFSGNLGEDVPPILTASAAEVAAMDRKCINDLLLRVKDQKVNLFQAYAEREQTAKTIGNMAIRVAKGLQNLKHGDFAGAANAFGIKSHQKNAEWFNARWRKNQSKAIANGWLELQYGWRPLINDVYGAAEALAKVQFGTPREKVVIRRKLVGARDSQATPNSQVRTIDHGTYDIQLLYGCYFTAQSQELKTLSELGITNPALIAWELMPWSFVIDWFIPIGDFVSGWDATLGLKFLNGYRTEFRREKTTRTFYYGPGNGTGGKLSGYSQSSSERVTCVRTKLNSFPSPQLPNFKNPVGVEHMLNAIALLQQFR